MSFSKFLAAIVCAALVSFGWGVVSWMLAGWHDPQPFKDPKAVAATIQANVPTHGIYMLPDVVTSVSDDAKTKARANEAVRRGPHMWAIIRPGPGHWSMGWNFVLSFARSLAAAFLLLLILWPLRAGSRVWMVAMSAAVALVVCLQSDAIFCIWFEEPWLSLFANCLDHLVEGLLTGLVLALFLHAPRRPALRL